DLERDVLDRLTDAPEPAVAGPVHGHDRRRLGEPRALVDLDAEPVDELADLVRQRGASADRVLETAAELAADRGEQEARRPAGDALAQSEPFAPPPAL